MIFDSTALVLPLKLFSAKWNADRGRSREFMSFSHKELSRFCGFLRGEESFSNVIDLDVLDGEQVLNTLKYHLVVLGNIKHYGIGVEVIGAKNNFL